MSWLQKCFRSPSTWTEASFQKTWIVVFGFYVFWSLIYLTPMPKWDDYDVILRFLNQYKEANLEDRLQLIFSQHNEHRIVFSRLFYASFFEVFGFIDLRVVQILGDLGWVLFCFVLIRRLNSFSLKLMASFLLFSLRPTQLFFFPMAAFQQYYQLLFSALCIYYYIGQENKFANSKMFLFMALTCLSGGGWMALLPVPLVQIAKKRKASSRDFFFLFGMLACFIYYFVLFKYERPPYHPSIVEALASPTQLVGFVFSFLGSVFENQILALILGFALFLVSTREIWVSKSFESSLAVCIMTTGLMTALARSAFGVKYALSDRYTIYSIALCAVVLSCYQQKIKLRPKLYSALFWVTTIFFLDSTIKGYKDLRGHYTDVKSAKIIFEGDAQRAEDILKTSKELGVCNCDWPVHGSNHK